MSLYGFLKGGANLFVQTVFPYKLIGKEKIKDGPCILVGNHYRIWDIVHMAHCTKKELHFITKQELYKSKILAYFCNKIQAIPVSRDGQDAKAVMTSLRYLKNGEIISMFPEGTRNKTEEELLPLHGGAALFAIKAKVPVYPVMCLNKTRPFKKTKIIVGDPIDFSEFYGKRMTAEDYTAAEDIIREKMLATKHDYIVMLKNRKKEKKDKKKKGKNK